MLEIILSLANLVLLILAQLNLWLPITFKRLDPIGNNYPFLIVFPLMVIMAAKYVRKHNALPTTQNMSDEIYTDDPITMKQREYIINFIALLVYQIFIVWIFH